MVSSSQLTFPSILLALGMFGSGSAARAGTLPGTAKVTITLPACTLTWIPGQGCPVRLPCRSLVGDWFMPPRSPVQTAANDPITFSFPLGSISTFTCAQGSGSNAKRGTYLISYETQAVQSGARLLPEGLQILEQQDGGDVVVGASKADPDRGSYAFKF